MESSDNSSMVGASSSIFNIQWSVLYNRVYKCEFKQYFASIRGSSIYREVR